MTQKARRRILLDFETYSEQTDLDGVGSYEYAFDPTTDVICMGYDLSDGLGPRLWRGPRFKPSAEPFPADLIAALHEPHETWAHHAEFDRAIFMSCVHRRIPGVPMPQNWRCSAVLARSVGLPGSLESCAIALGLSQVKNTRGKYLIKKLSMPQKSRDLFDTDLYSEMGEYCLQDVRVLSEIVKCLPDLSEQEWSYYELTVSMNARGVRVDREFCQSACELVDTEIAAMNQRVFEITGGSINTVTQRDAILAWVNGQGVKIPNLQAPTVKEYLAKPYLPDHVRVVLEARRDGSRTSPAKYKKALLRSNLDGRLRGEFVFYGAQTGRWSSRGVQLQNFTRGGIKNMDFLVDSLKKRLYPMLWPHISPMDLLSWAVRGLLCADEGKTLLTLDYASIEARGVLWLSGNRKAMEVFRSGGDIYKEMASQIYKVPVASVTSDQRRIGKQAVLGLGYGMGIKGFYEKCQSEGIKDMTPEFAQVVVESYRNDLFPDVPRLWADLESCARSAISGMSANVCGLFFYRQGDFLFCRLPSGRTLRYFRPEIEGRQLSYAYAENGVMKRDKMYGGSLMENVASGMCRDFMASAMYDSISHGFTPVMTVHDEIVLEAPQGTTLDSFKQVMLGALPSWANGFPLDVDGWVGDRYRK